MKLTLAATWPLARTMLFVGVALVFLLFSCVRKSQPPDNLTPLALISASLDVSITDGLDDGEEYSSGSVNRSSTDLDLGLFPTVGMRFTSVNLPPGAIIDSAYVQFKTDESHAVASSLNIRAEAADDASGLLGKKFNLSTRPTTTAAVAWSPNPWQTVGEAGVDQQTPDLAPIIQEIVDRPGWVSGNALLLLVTGTGEHVAESYNGDQAGAPLLHIDYSYYESPPSIDSYAVDPTVAVINETVTFSWSVSDPEGQALSCTLDIDDDGAADYTYGDCTAVSSQDHSYAAAGEYTALLSVTDSDGVTANDAVMVNVADTGNTVTVVAAGDIACDPTSGRYGGANPNHCQELATSDLALAVNPDAVLALGDTVYQEGTTEQFMTSYDPTWGRLKAITYPVVGNHEYQTPGASGYYQYFGPAAGDPTKGYYTFDLGNWHIIVLNSQCSQIGGCSSFSPQGQWLRNELAANPAACTLALWHIPRFSSGRIGNRTYTQDFWTELYDAGADLILTGHDHDYERFGPQTPGAVADPANGIVQFVVGTGGKSVLSGGTMQPNSEAFDQDTPGVLKLVLKSTGYDWEFLPVPGKTFTDSGSGVCH